LPAKKEILAYETSRQKWPQFLERRARENFKKLLPRRQRPPSADTVHHSSTRMDLDPVTEVMGR
jgi:hypothetical protein